MRTAYSGISALIPSDELRKFRVFPGRSNRPVRSLGSPSATTDRFPWLVAGSWVSLVVEPSKSATTLGLTNFVFDLMKNGASTGMSATWSGADVSRKTIAGPVTANGTTDSFALEFRPNPERDPLGQSFSFLHAINFDSADDFTSGYAVIGFDGPNDTGEWWNSPFYPSDDFFNGAQVCKTLIGPAGTIEGLRILKPASQTVGTAHYVLELDGVIQNGSGGTVDTRVDLGPSVFDQTVLFSLPVTTCQTIRLRTTTTGAAFAPRVSFGIKFRATTAHRFWFGGWSASGGQFGTPPSTDYIALEAETFNHAWRTAPTALNGGLLDWINPERVTTYGLCIWQQLAPGSNGTRTFDGVVNGVPVVGGPSVTLAGGTSPATGDAPASAIITFGTDDTVSLRNVTAGTIVGDGQETAWVFQFGATTLLTGTLIVEKVVVGGDPLTVFDIDVGGGVTPAALALSDGQSQTYTGVPVGSGYSVQETPPASWTVGIVVSNASDPTNITIAADEVVTVTVTNTFVPPPVCPGDTTDALIDGLPYTPAQAAPCAGSGTIGAPPVGA